MYIYCITNLVNNKKYVGQTINDPEDRWKQHVNYSRRSKFAIHNAFTKYGIDSFNFEVIDESANNIDELNDLEEFYISFYDTFYGHGYNMTSGGDNALHTEETKKKISEGNKSKKLSEEAKKKIGDANRGNTYWVGKSHSEESKQKMSITRKDRNGIQSHSSKKVVQIDKDTGEEIACWFSMNEVQREIGIMQQNISKCCLNRKYFKTAGGFMWRYL